jgi:hypothetical protein
MENNNERIINHKDIQKMIFIFNALHDGWTVKKIQDNKFEFTKENEKIQKEIVLEDYIKKFLKFDVNI